jgi:prophage regulatory protein
MQAAQTRRTIRRDQVLRKTGLSRTNLYLLERKGEFPKHFLLTPRCAVWFEDEIDNWLEARREALVKAAPWPNVSLRRVARGRPARANAEPVIRTVHASRLNKK